ncbi:FcoT family thioesterase [Streptomyces sp. NBRC 110028]|uniref:FcoT family thioesterase n=1 Tax=Streptomyces sp. NBRC 110028 TaxID=1621260 RepID=UPI0006E2397D|nr:FcoT family thioesterase [Streptomyces sp. NBRC 110028]
MTRLLHDPLDDTDQRVYPTDEELLHRVLTPYRAKRCEYLTSATVTVAGDPLDGGRLGAACTFLIPESCYIDDTGHFNSVEFNICFNQMAYYLMAKSVKESLVAPFSRWTLEQFWTRQLADVFITDFKSTFRTAMSGRHFRGEIEIADIAEWDANDLRDALVMLRTRCRYWDEQGGESHGEIAAAITNPPEN